MTTTMTTTVTASATPTLPAFKGGKPTRGIEEVRRAVAENYHRTLLAAWEEWLEEFEVCRKDKRAALAWELLPCTLQTRMLPRVLRALATRLRTAPFSATEEGDLLARLVAHTQDVAAEGCDLAAFWEAIWHMRPRAAATSPTADTGAGELLVRLTDPTRSVPQRGDSVRADGVREELKAWKGDIGAQILHPRLRGPTYRAEAEKALLGEFEGHGTRAKGLKGAVLAEPEKRGRAQHWEKQFADGLADGRTHRALTRYVRAFDLATAGQDVGATTAATTPESIAQWIAGPPAERCSGYQGRLELLWAAKCFAEYQAQDGFNCMVMVGNGRSVVRVESARGLVKKIRDGALAITGDYFRVAQNRSRVGIYVGYPSRHPGSAVGGNRTKRKRR